VTPQCPWSSHWISEGVVLRCGISYSYWSIRYSIEALQCIREGFSMLKDYLKCGHRKIDR
jgi:hypothetical protein